MHSLIVTKYLPYLVAGDLIEAVHELSHGYACPETVELVESLQTDLPSGPCARLFALKYDVDKCNSDHLLDIDGKLTLISNKLQKIRLLPFRMMLFL